PDLGKVVGCDLEDLRGIPEAMDFVERQAASAQAPEKRLRVFHFSPDAGEFAVEILGVGEALADHGFPCAPDAGKPDQGPALPSFFDAREPESAGYHTSLVLRIVTLNAIV